MPWIGILIISTIGIIGLTTAYLNVDHVAQRLNSYLNPSSGDTFQVDTAHNAIIKGGWLGKGPGEGTIKNILPDAHTDFIFAVAAEEYGIFICLAFCIHSVKRFSASNVKSRYFFEAIYCRIIINDWNTIWYKYRC